MHLPTYKDQSIVNLMSSILSAYGETPTYRPLKNLDVETLKRSVNIILFVIDGLGHDFLMHHAKDSALAKFPRARITSVFPSTTATAITTFTTGLAPQQHAITGWFMYLKEIGSVVKILPFTPRNYGNTVSLVNIEMDDILACDTMPSRIRADSFFFTPCFLHGSAYTRATSRGAEMVAYDSLSDCIAKITTVINTGCRSKFLYVYWPEFDSICHNSGVESPAARAHFKELEHAIDELIRMLEGSETTLLLTSDHGMVDTKQKDFINLNEHPDLAATLTLPLCGEPRVAYCYVRPSRLNRFREYIAKKFSSYCSVHSSHELIKKGFFGLYEPSAKLFDRVGDYVLITKENYIIKDFLPGEAEHFSKANHGGVSSKEMYVPLITVSC
jgi:predicted AlkP superfamily pyrophosphatase or phosphodiesterase